MQTEWGIGVDIGGTKIEVACIDRTGKILHRMKFPTNISRGPDSIIQDIISAIQKLQNEMKAKPVGIGVGMAGQIVPHKGVLKFAPNLKWENVNLQSILNSALNLPVLVVNDVRAATMGEWMHGAGKGCDDILCLFIGTGIGGGIVSDGRILVGANNSAGELGHTVIEMNGPECTCGNHGCFEAIAGGWALAKQAKGAIEDEPAAGAAILKLANGRLEDISAYHIVGAAKARDALANQIVYDAIEAIIIGCSSLVNAFNPKRLILGGGLGLALPNLIESVKKGVHGRALLAATEGLEIVPASLLNDAGVIGAACMVLKCSSEL